MLYKMCDKNEFLVCFNNCLHVNIKMLHDFTCDVTCMSLMIQAQMFQSKYLKNQARNEKDVGGVFTPPPPTSRYLPLADNRCVEIVL